ncbi:MAG: hypothetical protein V1835_06170 [Candidatus Micrarchaeota archaeon]
MKKFSYLAIGLLVVVLAAYVYADYAETAVYFTVPIEISFTVTLPGPEVYTSNTTYHTTGPTSDIWFNSSSSSNFTAIQPCVFPGTNCQNDANPIFQYDNTGTVPITIYLKFNASLPSGVNLLMNSSVAGTGNGGTAHAELIPLNDTEWAPVVLDLSFEGTNTSGAWLFANFTVYSGTEVRYLISNSTQ